MRLHFKVMEIVWNQTEVVAAHHYECTLWYTEVFIVKQLILRYIMFTSINYLKINK